MGSRFVSGWITWLGEMLSPYAFPPVLIKGIASTNVFFGQTVISLFQRRKDSNINISLLIANMDVRYFTCNLHILCSVCSTVICLLFPGVVLA